MRLRRALTGVVTAAVLVVPTACSSGSPTSTPPTPSATGPTTPAPGAGSTGSAAAAVDHTVPVPGPRQPGVLAPADILVVAGTTLSEAQVAAVKKVKGVASSAVIAMSEPSIENRSLKVAAVDPAEYRTFTNQTTAAFQEGWDRLAGGELALKRRLQGRLPVDAQGYLRLGGAEDAPAVHVGAYIDQQALIDAVVNKTWVETLGMTPDNAMLIRTGDRAPGAVRDAIEEVLGEDASVQLVDKATRLGIDPSAVQVAVVTGSVSDAVGVYRYSVLGGGRIAPDPAWVSAHITTEVVPILGSVTCNRLIFPQLKAALSEIQALGMAGEIHPSQYAGCYYPRFIAGSSTLSNHAYGLALDLNAVENGRGTAGRLSPGLVAVFKRWGFAWGGDWHYTDPMHFEMNQVKSPASASARSSAP